MRFSMSDALILRPWMDWEPSALESHQKAPSKYASLFRKWVQGAVYRVQFLHVINRVHVIPLETLLGGERVERRLRLTNYTSVRASFICR